MKKAVIIGGRGKVGSYLVPALVESGFSVVNISRGITKPNIESPAWKDVEQLTLDREADGFADKVAALSADCVIDMICFENSDMNALIDRLSGNVGHYLVCGSIWIHGRSRTVPVKEEESRDPPDHYGQQKSLMDYSITARFQDSGFPGTAIHPGHIVCPGDVPINPQGFKGLSAFTALRDGESLRLPNFGMETLHHVHASDVAGVFMAAIKAGKPAFGEGFHAVSPAAVTLYGYAVEVAGWFSKEARLLFEPFDKWKNHFSDSDAEATLEHIHRSPSCSMEKAHRLLGFTPEFTTYEAVRECIASFGFG